MEKKVYSLASISSFVIAILASKTEKYVKSRSNNNEWREEKNKTIKRKTKSMQ